LIGAVEIAVAKLGLTALLIHLLWQVGVELCFRIVPAISTNGGAIAIVNTFTHRGVKGTVAIVICIASSLHPLRIKMPLRP
jgi:hypothetical protein